MFFFAHGSQKSDTDSIQTDAKDRMKIPGARGPSEMTLPDSGHTIRQWVLPQKRIRIQVRIPGDSPPID